MSSPVAFPLALALACPHSVVTRLGSSSSVLVLKSALSTFSKVLGCAYKHFINQSLCACACA